MLKVVARTMEVGDRKTDYASRVEEERKERLKENVLHGKSFREVGGLLMVDLGCGLELDI